MYVLVIVVVMIIVIMTKKLKSDRRISRKLTMTKIQHFFYILFSHFTNTQNTSFRLLFFLSEIHLKNDLKEIPFKRLIQSEHTIFNLNITQPNEKKKKIGAN